MSKVTFGNIRQKVEELIKQMRAQRSLRIVRSGNNDTVTQTGNGTLINLKEFPSVSGGGGAGVGPRLWDVTLTNVELSPLSIMADVLEDTLTSWENAIPSEGDFNNVITPIFTGFDRNSTPPTSISTSIENLFTSLQTIVDGFQNSVDTILNNINPISTALTNFFENLETFPSDGDYIYNDILGIGYTVFEKNAIRPAGIANPTGNLIFRVEFPVTLNAGESNEVIRDFCAMTLFPNPNIGKLLTNLIQYLLTFVKKVLSQGLSSLVVNITTGILNGLNDLFSELQALIDAITNFDPTYLENAINALETDLTTLTDRVDALELAQDAIQQALDALEATIDGSVTVQVIGADGNYHTLKVQEDTLGTSAEREITWIDSSSGEGRKGSFLIKDGAPAPVGNIQDIDWRKIDYIHPDGTTYTMNCLVNIANGDPADTADWPNYTLEAVEICDPTNGVVSKDALFRQ